ncbi:hypothetical protein [Pluralibacter gergoviae]|nr:hypothetical protein [Pluralibacter gergoviae]
MVYFKDGIISVPVQWSVKQKNCLYISRTNQVNGLEVCSYMAEYGSNYFRENGEGKWEATSDGIPVLANLDRISKFTGMSARTQCRYDDGTGYHITYCFQDEISLPDDMKYTFIAIGDPYFFEEYNKIYLSFRAKND